MKKSVRFPVKIACGLFLLFSAKAHAVNVGIFAGADYNYFNWFTSVPANQYVGSGFAFSGGVSLSFFDYSRFGFRLSALENLVSVPTTSAFGSSGINISGSMPMALATLDVNFDWGINRHSLGLGYGYESLSSLSFSSSANVPASTAGGGFVLDAKDYWKNGMFDYAVIFFPHDNLNAYYSFYTVTLGIGYEFGEHGK